MNIWKFQYPISIFNRDKLLGIVSPEEAAPSLPRLSPASSWLQWWLLSLSPCFLSRGSAQPSKRQYHWAAHQCSCLYSLGYVWSVAPYPESALWCPSSVSLHSSGKTLTPCSCLGWTYTSHLECTECLKQSCWMGRTWCWLEPDLDARVVWKGGLEQGCCSWNSCWSSTGWHWHSWPRQVGCCDSWMPWWRWQGGSDWSLVESTRPSVWNQSAPYLQSSGCLKLYYWWKKKRSYQGFSWVVNVLMKAGFSLRCLPGNELKNTLKVNWHA